MTVIKDLFIRLNGDTANFHQSMNTAANRINTMSTSMTRAGTVMTAGVTTPIIGISTASINMANDLNGGLANVASLGDEAAAMVGEWKPAIQDIALSVGKGTDDMTSGMYNVVSAFGVTGDSLDVLDINARAGAAGLATTTDAINLTSAVTKAYGDTSAASVQQVADLALKTVQLGQTTFPELAASIGTVTPLTAELGVKQEELFGVLATATGVTGGASEVNTQLRGVLQSLMAPTEDMSTLINSLGYESGAAMLQQEGLQGTIGKIVEAAEATGQPLQKYIGSIEGQTLALALAGPQSAVFSEKIAAMGSAAGATATAFAAQTEGINKDGFAAQQAGIKMQIWGQQIGQQLLPVVAILTEELSPLVSWVSQLIESFVALDPAQQKVVLGVVGVIAVIGPVLLIFGQLAEAISTIITVVSTVTPVITGLGGAIAALSAPVTLAIGAIVGAVFLLREAWVRDFGGIKLFAEEIWAAIQLAFTAFKDLFSGDFQGFLDGISAAWELGWGAVTDFAGRIWSIIQPNMTAFWQNFTTWWNGLNWMQIASNAIGWVVDGISTIWERVSVPMGDFWSSLSSWWNELSWYQMSYDTMTFILEAFELLWTRVLVPMAQFWADFTTWWLTLDWMQIAVDAVTFIVDGIATIWAAVSPVMAQFWTDIQAWFTSINWSDLATNIVNGLVQGIRDGGQYIYDAVWEIAQGAWDAIVDFFDMRSPSRRMIGGGHFVGGGLAIGLIESIPRVVNASRRLAAAALPSPTLPNVGVGVAFGRTQPPSSQANAGGRSVTLNFGDIIINGVDNGREAGEQFTDTVLERARLLGVV